MLYLSVCMCTTYVPAACEGQKRMSEHLELELQSVMSSHVTMWVLRLKWGSSERTASALNH